MMISLSNWNFISFCKYLSAGMHKSRVPVCWGDWIL
jgi:hypothetical protein